MAQSSTLYVGMDVHKESIAVACVFRSKVATDSGRNLPPIPGEGCH